MKFKISMISSAIAAALGTTFPGATSASADHKTFNDLDRIRQRQSSTPHGQLGFLGVKPNIRQSLAATNSDALAQIGRVTSSRRIAVDQSNSQPNTSAGTLGITTS